MIEQLRGAWLKLKWAKEDIQDLDAKVVAFLKRKPWICTSEPHRDMPECYTYKFGFTEDISDQFAKLTSNSANALHSALDYTNGAISVAMGSRVRNPYFPFSGKDTFENTLKGRCVGFPEDILAIIRNLKPYRGGNNTLWALHEICGSDKHTVITPTVTGSFQVGHGLGGLVSFSLPISHEWDSAKNELQVIGPKPSPKFNYEHHLRLFIAFGEISVIQGKPLVPVLRKMASQVNQIVTVLEEASIRCGVFD